MKQKKKKGQSTPHAHAPILLDPAPLRRRAEAISFELVRAALKGDRAALRLCVERLFSVPRERAVPLPIPAAASALEVASALQFVFDALRAGQITPGEAAKLAALLDSRRKAFETGALEARLLDLENAPRGGEPQEEIDYDNLPLALTPDLPDDSADEDDEPHAADATPEPSPRPLSNNVSSIVAYPAIQLKR